GIPSPWSDGRPARHPRLRRPVGNSIGRRTPGNTQRWPMDTPLAAPVTYRRAVTTGRRTRPCYPSTAAQPVATAPPRRRLRHVERPGGDREGTPLRRI